MTSPTASSPSRNGAGLAGIDFLPGLKTVEEVNRRAAEGELERAQKQVGLIDLSGDLAAAKAEQAKQQEAAREFARQAAAQFKAEQAAREFAKNAAEQFKAEMAAKAQAEQARQQAAERELARQKQEAEAKRQAEIERQQQPKNGRDNDGLAGRVNVI